LKGFISQLCVAILSRLLLSIQECVPVLGVPVLGVPSIYKRMTSLIVPDNEGKFQRTELNAESSWVSKDGWSVPKCTRTAARWLNTCSGKLSADW